MIFRGWLRIYESGHTANPRLAKDLRARLLSIDRGHGANGNLAAQIALAYPLVKAGQLVDSMPYPMQGHGIREPGRPHAFQRLSPWCQNHRGDPN